MTTPMPPEPPYEPTLPVPYVPSPPYQPQQVYYPQAQQAPYYPKPPVEHSVAGKAAIGTVAVIATLVAIFCVLPLVLCTVLGGIGAIFSGAASGN